MDEKHDTKGTEELRRWILERARSEGAVTTREVQEETGLSRQGAHYHLKELVDAGELRKVGRTRGARYVPADREDKGTRRFRDEFSREGLEEHLVMQRIEVELGLRESVSDQALHILRYAVSEILNNAIEHSGSPVVLVEAETGPYDVEFTIRDRGIGIYRKIAEGLGHGSEAEGLQDLLKGKTTTEPERHTGEGIYFSSKALDVLEITSHRLLLQFDNREDRVVTGTVRWLEGTRVEGSVRRRSRRELAGIFDAYGGAEFDFRFEKTRVKALLVAGGEGGLVSRSQARRLLERLDRFSVVVLDFSNVQRIGQGFADEVFRGFADRHPGIRLEVENASPAVEAMISHVSGGDFIQ